MACIFCACYGNESGFYLLALFLYNGQQTKQTTHSSEVYITHDGVHFGRFGDIKLTANNRAKYYNIWTPWIQRIYMILTLDIR